MANSIIQGQGASALMTADASQLCTSFGTLLLVENLDNVTLPASDDTCHREFNAVTYTR